MEGLSGASYRGILDGWHFIISGKSDVTPPDFETRLMMIINSIQGFFAFLRITAAEIKFILRSDTK